MSKRLLKDYAQLHMTEASDEEENRSCAIEMKPYLSEKDACSSKNNKIEEVTFLPPPCMAGGEAGDQMRQKALHEWTNTKHLDQLLIQIYEYYCGRGKNTMLLTKMSKIVIMAFLFVFVLFLANCIDYHRLFLPSEHRKHLSDFVQYDNLLFSSFFWTCCLLLFVIFITGQIVDLYFEFENITKTSNIFNHLLAIQDVSRCASFEHHS